MNTEISDHGLDLWCCECHQPIRVGQLYVCFEGGWTVHWSHVEEQQNQQESHARRLHP